MAWFKRRTTPEEMGDALIGINGMFLDNEMTRRFLRDVQKEHPETDDLRLVEETAIVIMFLLVQVAARTFRHSPLRDRMIGAFHRRFHANMTEALGAREAEALSERVYARYEEYVPLYQQDMLRAERDAPGTIPFRNLATAFLRNAASVELLEVGTARSARGLFFETPITQALWLRALKDTVSKTAKEFRLVG
jgi:hypothetical protein